MATVNLIVALALLQFFAFGAAVGRARGKYRVAAPAVTGNEMFERYYRVQMNTLELLIMFIPAMWMFGFYVSANVAAGLGALFLIGRGIYFFAYVAEPRKRELGYVLSAAPVVALVIGAIVGTARAIAQHHP
jgi:glutathione S-transferase